MKVKSACLFLTLFLVSGISVEAALPVKELTLESVAFDKKRPLKVRWKALVAMAMRDGKKGSSHFNRAIKSRDWFMRDAGLMALYHVDNTKGRKWALKLVKDPALVVRTRAVKILGKQPNKKDRDLLWGELNHRRNFRKGQSLWVRYHIVRVLGQVGVKEDLSKFVKLLDDPDKRVHLPAVTALERVTGQRLGKADEPVAYRRLYWKKWWDKFRKI